MLIRKDGSEIAAELRNRICMMQSATETITLHEGALATEFGVSRTPIRQVLQKLAYERLVEARSGVGTFVSPLNPDNRDRDVLVLKALFEAAAICGRGEDVSPLLRERLVVAEAISEATDPSKDSYLELRVQLLDLSASAVADDILSDALRAAHWRHIRWRMSENAWSEPEAQKRLHDTLVACVAAARKNDLGGVYKELSDRLV